MDESDQQSGVRLCHQEASSLGSRSVGNGSGIDGKDKAERRKPRQIRNDQLMKHTITLIASVLLAAPAALHAGGTPKQKPNIIFILSDDLAQGDLGCYGQKLIKTPRMDRMAAEGTRYLQAFCGTTVCAPSRTSLMTGLDTGHSPIRANREIQPEGQKPLPEGTFTVAKLLRRDG
jgi:hypothetical protein